MESSKLQLIYWSVRSSLQPCLPAPYRKQTDKKHFNKTFGFRGELGRVTPDTEQGAERLLQRSTEVGRGSRGLGARLKGLLS